MIMSISGLVAFSGNSTGFRRIGNNFSKRRAPCLSDHAATTSGRLRTSDLKDCVGQAVRNVIFEAFSNSEVAELLNVFTSNLKKIANIG